MEAKQGFWFFEGMKSFIIYIKEVSVEGREGLWNRCEMASESKKNHQPGPLLRSAGMAGGKVPEHR